MSDTYPKYNTQLEKDEHDNSSEPKTKRVLLYGWDATNLQKVRLAVTSNGELKQTASDDTVYITRIAADSEDSNITYIGEALPSTATSASNWKIQKIDETNGTVITYADGNGNFDNEWDERENLTYS